MSAISKPQRCSVGDKWITGAQCQVGETRLPDPGEANDDDELAASIAQLASMLVQWRAADFSWGAHPVTTISSIRNHMA
ncbi:hypothetical protein PM082_023264 [Marasmius tenuissimus]|nr:hypothetical protein PM082_023264 [Marasmius tenuissimus]